MCVSLYQKVSNDSPKWLYYFALIAEISSCFISFPKSGVVNFSILVGMKWYFIVIFIFIFFMCNDIQYLFINVLYFLLLKVCEIFSLPSLNWDVCFLSIEWKECLVYMIHKKVVICLYRCIIYLYTDESNMNASLVH